jgi:hypothetical protein
LIVVGVRPGLAEKLAIALPLLVSVRHLPVVLVNGKRARLYVHGPDRSKRPGLKHPVAPMWSVVKLRLR